MPRLGYRKTKNLSYGNSAIKMRAQRHRLKTPVRIWMQGFYEVAGKFFKHYDSLYLLEKYSIGRFDERKCHT